MSGWHRNVPHPWSSRQKRASKGFFSESKTTRTGPLLGNGLTASERTPESCPFVSQLNHVRAWAEFLGDRPFTSATEKDVRDFLLKRTIQRRWRPRGTAETTKNVRLSDGTIELRKVVLRNFQAFVRGCGKRDKLRRARDNAVRRPRINPRNPQ